jgi:hypothetical protein
VKDFLTSRTSVSNHHDFFVKLFSNIFAKIFTSSRAIIFFGAREIVFVSPSRKKIVTSFSSLSIPVSLPLTSFATIASQFFRRSFSRAFFQIMRLRGETVTRQTDVSEAKRESRVGNKWRVKADFFSFVAG